jgi:NAD(P)-dependent dehydrogenase (short-subunit alcohol dehydrogenase family)
VETVSTVPSSWRRVIVTGAGGGIGRAIVATLVGAGCRVGACDLREPLALGDDEALAGVPTAAFDVSDPQDARAGVEALAGALGGVDAVVGNAGIVDTIHRAEDFPDEAWRRDIETNLSGQFHVARAAFPALSQSQDGRIVFVSSASAESGLPGQVAYTAAKAGIVGMARTLAAEWAQHDIRVNVVMPGLVATPKVLAMPAAVRELLAGEIPLARTAEPEELAGVIAFLLSPAAAYITGTVLRVDGGLGLARTGLHRR